MAGLAAVVGLIVLTVLYVSQARDVKRLREWAGRAPEVSRQRPNVTARPWYSRIGTRHIALALVGVFVLCAAAANGVTQLTGDDTSGNAQHHKPKPGGAAVEPGSVTVAVLNGTRVPGLAATLRDRVAAAGFRKGEISDFPDQQLAQSIVEYAPGHEADAKVVSRRVGISQRQPVTERSRALAGDAAVIVVAGADKAP